MLGCERRAAEIASCRNRARVPSSAARSARRIFTATRRDSTGSSAVQTVAMPPRAMGATSWYRPPRTRPGAVISTAALLPSRDGLERHSDDAGAGMGADDRSDHAGDDVIAREDGV